MTFLILFLLIGGFIGIVMLDKKVQKKLDHKLTAKQAKKDRQLINLDDIEMDQ